MLKNLWMDEGGALLSMEAVLLATILVIGVIVGLSSVQNAVVTELADVAAAVGSVNQSYSTFGVTGHHSSTAGSIYADVQDACDIATTGSNSSACVAVCSVDAPGEG